MPMIVVEKEDSPIFEASTHLSTIIGRNFFSNSLPRLLVDSDCKSFRTSPNRKSGHAFVISEFFTFDHAVNWQMEKQTTVPFFALVGESRPEQLQLAGPLAKKISKVVRPRDAECGDPISSSTLTVG